MFNKNFISLILYSLHFIFLKIKVFGSNTLFVYKNVILWKSNIEVNGKNNSIKLRNSAILKHTKITVNGNNNHIIIDENVRVYENCEFLIEGDNCEIYVGKKTTIGSASIFCGEGNTSISIGEDCMLSREVSMNTSDFHSIIDKNTNLRINIPQNIIIHDNVWIGFNTRINKGAVIGEHSVVATAAIVPGKHYHSNVILAGIPAKIIKENITWSREKLPF
jgi:acetyltransferase-like isoleucine patch superfamily enzyme